MAARAPGWASTSCRSKEPWRSQRLRDWEGWAAISAAILVPRKPIISWMGLFGQKCLYDQSLLFPFSVQSVKNVMSCLSGRPRVTTWTSGRREAQSSQVLIHRESLRREQSLPCKHPLNGGQRLSLEGLRGCGSSLGSNLTDPFTLACFVLPAYTMSCSLLVFPLCGTGM